MGHNQIISFLSHSTQAPVQRFLRATAWNASRVLAIVQVSVRPSVCHTLDLY